MWVFRIDESDEMRFSMESREDVDREIRIIDERCEARQLIMGGGSIKVLNGASLQDK